ncbi:hypothetical protein EYF80_002882 [Liparis tanakae]|uniref:Uncharacterized protein n=1 Tax=Liparis tanakae TaxID=230148 RepID=A0A4Z2J935_9TELE|nr:hypothetical protein EYF80_002882 [Liparis tanakae]
MEDAGDPQDDEAEDEDDQNHDSSTASGFLNYGKSQVSKHLEMDLRQRFGHVVSLHSVLQYTHSSTNAPVTNKERSEAAKLGSFSWRHIEIR